MKRGVIERTKESVAIEGRRHREKQKEWQMKGGAIERSK